MQVCSFVTAAPQRPWDCPPRGSGLFRLIPPLAANQQISVDLCPPCLNQNCCVRGVCVCEGFLIAKPLKPAAWTIYPLFPNRNLCPSGWTGLGFHWSSLLSLLTCLPCLYIFLFYPYPDTTRSHCHQPHVFLTSNWGMIMSYWWH